MNEYPDVTDEGLIDAVARGIFTGILYGGNDDAWNNELVDGPTVWVRDSRNWYRCGAIDAIRAYEAWKADNP